MVLGAVTRRTKGLPRHMGLSFKSNFAASGKQPFHQRQRKQQQLKGSANKQSRTLTGFKDHEVIGTPFQPRVTEQHQLSGGHAIPSKAGFGHPTPDAPPPYSGPTAAPYSTPTSPSYASHSSYDNAHPSAAGAAEHPHAPRGTSHPYNASQEQAMRDHIDFVVHWGSAMVMVSFAYLLSVEWDDYILSEREFQSGVRIIPVGHKDPVANGASSSDVSVVEAEDGTKHLTSRVTIVLYPSSEEAQANADFDQPPTASHSTTTTAINGEAVQQLASDVFKALNKASSQDSGDDTQKEPRNTKKKDE